MDGFIGMVGPTTRYLPSTHALAVSMIGLEVDNCSFRIHKSYHVRSIIIFNVVHRCNTSLCDVQQPSGK